VDRNVRTVENLNKFVRHTARCSENVRIESRYSNHSISAKKREKLKKDTTNFGGGRRR